MYGMLASPESHSPESRAEVGMSQAQLHCRQPPHMAHGPESDKVKVLGAYGGSPMAPRSRHGIPKAPS